MPKIREIIGHTMQLEQLKSDLVSGNVTHAYLFSGPRNLGKMTLAHWFSFQLLSVGVPDDELSELETQVERLMHPDFLVLDQLWMENVCEDWEVIAKSSNISQGHRAKKPSAKTDSISIDDIRVLQERLLETSIGKWRCCIIRSVERMQDAAANAFLRILEEPPPGLVFILTTQTQSSLLPTIVSRTRPMSFRRLSSKDLRVLLSGVPEEDAQFIMHIAHGAPGIVHQLCDDPDALREHRLVHSAAQSFWQSASLRERLQKLTPLHSRGEESDQFLLHLGLTLREQSPAISPLQVQALQNLSVALRTNAHRQLLAQRFALSVS